MALRDELLQTLDGWLMPRSFSDYCPNGLQVEGRLQIQRLATGVTASLAVIEKALALQADMLLVHHGYFWKGEDPCIRGMKQRRLQLLLSHQVNLVAYHLPLDAHPELGNNRQLALRLGWPQARPLTDAPDELVWTVALSQPITAEALSQSLSQALGRPPVVIATGPALIRRLAFCTGAAQGYLHRAVSAGCDAYISGEISENTVHSARECGIHYFSAGHHATERYGVQALGEALARAMGIEHQFIDDENPV